MPPCDYVYNFPFNPIFANIHCPIPTTMSMAFTAQQAQYFTTPHAIHMDSSGLHWTSLYTGPYSQIWTPLDCQYKTGLHWTANHILTQNWIPLDCQLYTDTKLDSTGFHWTVSHILTQNWIPLDSTGLSAIYWHKTGLYWTPLDQYFTLPGLFHMESMEWRVEADGFHGLANGFHGLSRWIPYCLSQTSCHLKIPYKTHMWT